MTVNQIGAERRARRTPKALDRAALDRLALHYLGRFATTRARLADYLRRKIAERGWDGDQEPPIERIVERMAALGYVDDRAFAEMRAAALARRGYGARRVDMALRASGIRDETIAELRGDDGDDGDDAALDAAIAFARRRRLGPFGNGPDDPKTRQRAFAAMQRAGHVPAIIARVFSIDPFAADASD